MRNLTAAALFLTLAGSQMGGCGSGGGVFVSYVVVVNTPDTFTATVYKATDQSDARDEHTRQGKQESPPSQTQATSSPRK